MGSPYRDLCRRRIISDNIIHGNQGANTESVGLLVLWNESVSQETKEQSLQSCVTKIRSEHDGQAQYMM